MADAVRVYKSRANSKLVKFPRDITDEVYTSQIRTKPDLSGVLIATWTVTVTDAAQGELVLSLTEEQAAGIAETSGYMDLKREVDGVALPVHTHPIEVVFVGAVTE